MRRFADLYAALDETTKTTRKVAAMAEYFQSATPADAMWAVYFLSGRKPRQIVPVARLRSWAMEQAAIPDWLFDECYQSVGDLAETMALLLPSSHATTDLPLAVWVEERLLPLRGREEPEQKSGILAAWSELNARQRFIWNKLLTGSFRVGVSQSLVVRALASATNIPSEIITHRLMGDWQPTATFHAMLVNPDASTAVLSRPYPFFLAHPLESDPERLGPIAEWQAEWKWDGIRAQILRRGGESFVWSRGEELVTDRYPELKTLADRLPDGTAIDGEILPWNETVLAFAELQRRIGRKTVGKKLLAEVPVIMMAYDLLEIDNRDLRETPLVVRRTTLEGLVEKQNEPSLLISPLLEAATWETLAALRQSSRARRVEGLMLKRLNSPYRVGRVRGDWWKWKLAPLSVDAVLIYAQPGHGKRSGLFTDYTLGVWHDGKLVPFAKAYSGLTDAEIREVDAFVRANVLEKFGPVRTVKPELVFEIGFEGIQASTRHKSGVAVRFPRMLRWRKDKPASEADTLDAVKALMEIRS